MCFNWTLKTCVICHRLTWNTTNVCRKCIYMIYDYSNKNSFSDFGEYTHLR